MAARRRKYKRPTPEQRKAMTPEELREHKRALNAERQAKYRVGLRKQTRAERRERRQRETAALFTWERILPYIRREPGGHWIWLRGFRAKDGVVRPWLRGGVLGGVRADYVVCCLYRGRPPPNCLVASVCDTIGCIAPEHLVWSNQAVETAKRRRRNVQEELARRVE